MRYHHRADQRTGRVSAAGCAGQNTMQVEMLYLALERGGKPACWYSRHSIASCRNTASNAASTALLTLSFAGLVCLGVPVETACADPTRATRLAVVQRCARCRGDERHGLRWSCVAASRGFLWATDACRGRHAQWQDIRRLHSFTPQDPQKVRAPKSDVVFL